MSKRFLLLFLTFSVLVTNPKTTLHGGQSRSWSAEQGKKENVLRHGTYLQVVFVVFVLHTISYICVSMMSKR